MRVIGVIDRGQLGSFLVVSLLVLSLFAMGSVGSVTSADTDQVAVDRNDVEIDPTLQQTSEEEVQVLVRLDEYNPSADEIGMLSAKTL